MINLEDSKLVIGYHGCDAKVRDQLVSRKLAHLEMSNNPYDWLGTGIYFYENDAKRALHFATAAATYPDRKYSAKPIESPSVVGAVLRLGTCWDLSSQVGLKVFQATHDRMVEQGIPLPKPNKQANPEDEDLILRPFDRAVINTGHNAQSDIKASYDSVRSIFSQGSAVVSGSGFKKLNHVQIAIRNTQCILGYFVPIFENDEDMK